jgi:FAD:protein FMN transferase
VIAGAAIVATAPAVVRGAIVTTLIPLLLVARCEAAVARAGQPVMGTILSVTVVADDEAKARLLAEDAIAEAKRWDDALTIWRKDGELARWNERAGSGPVEVSPRLARGLASMLELASATGGAFDPAVGSFRFQADVRAAGGIDRVLRLHAGRAALERGAAIDPGAIGKGLALDAIVELLESRGVRSAFLDFGGSSQTGVGSPPYDVRGWPVLISGWAAGSSYGIVRLRDASLSTSRAGAEDTAPIVDPRSGLPVPSPRLAAVHCASATGADAWSTALVVTGRAGLEAARNAGVEALLEDAQGPTRTPGFETSPQP